MTLDELLIYAQANAPAMLVATGALSTGEAEIEAARQLSPYNPTLTVGLGQRSQAGGRGLDAQVSLEQQVEIAGQRRSRRRAALREREHHRLGVDTAAWQVHALVHFHFEMALLAEQQLELAHQLENLDARVLATVERRVELGDESPVALELARAHLALAQNEAVTAATRVEVARLDLARSSGWTEPTTLRPRGQLHSPQPVEAGAEAIELAIADSPILRLADAQREAADAQVEVAKREAWPSPTLGISYAREGSTSTPGNSNPPSDVWMGTLQIPIPAFARNQGAVARRKAQLEVARARSRAISVQFESGVAASIARLNAAATRFEALDGQVVPALERALAASQRAYEVGDLDFQGVARAREVLWRARLDALEMRAEYYEAFAETERLVGPIPTAPARTLASSDPKRSKSEVGGSDEDK